MGAREEFFRAFDWITNNKFILMCRHLQCCVGWWGEEPSRWWRSILYLGLSDRQPVGLELQTPIQQLGGGSGGGTGLSTIDSLGILEGSNFEAFV